MNDNKDTMNNITSTTSYPKTHDNEDEYISQTTYRIMSQIMKESRN